MTSVRGKLVWLILLTPLYWLSVANAVPSFARQTGMPCSACHTVFPELTAFGRSFKANGYTLTTKPSTTPGLSEDIAAPLSAMVQVSFTSTRRAQPQSQNRTVLFPDELSLFYAGRISNAMGSFMQLTYEGSEDHFSLDNTDIRAAGKTQGEHAMVYGATLNNNPGVQDLWNSSPVWGFPYAGSGVAPSPAAATLLDGSLGQAVAGLGAYAYYRGMVYAELTGYRASQIGESQPPGSGASDVVKGTAPYWRLAVSGESGSHAWEVGTSGLVANIYPSGVSGGTDHFRDLALDAQYQYLADDHIVTGHAIFIQERRQWDVSFPAGDTANRSDDLRTVKADVGYYFKRRVGGVLGLFITDGDRDPVLYAPGPVEGSRNGQPDSRGAIVEVDYFPWLNTRFSAQYVLYNRFNGTSSNYDGSGRDASDNNVLYLNAWLMY